MKHTADQVDVVVLAGGINRIPLFDGYTPGYKALLPLGGRACIEYTLAALRGVPEVRRVCIVGPEAELRPVVIKNISGCVAPAFVPGGETLVGSIINGLSHFHDSPMVLIATADIPLITTDAIRNFLAACARVETDYKENLYLSVVPRQYYTGAYEKFPKAFNRFRDIAVCHGNLFLADPRLLDNQAALTRINQIYNARKSPITAALAVGLRVGLSYVIGVELLHALTMQRISRIASQRFGIGLLPVIVEHPGITIDVDEAADYEFVKEQLEA